MYLMEMNNFEYNSRNDKAVFSSFAIHPLLSESDYSKLPFQKERNDLKFENITLQGLDILSLIDRGEIRMKQMKIGAGSWNVYLSRIPPLPPSRKEVVPAQKLMKIRVPLIIEEFQVENFQLKYKEFNTATKETGRVNFNDISGKIDHITNIISEINRNAHAKMAMRARLMNSGPFKANFDFLLNDVTGRFSVTASLGRMDATELNPGFIPLNKIEIKKGTIDEMSCSGSGNENFAKGDASLLYHDLHISIMGKDKNADTLKRKSLVSLVANIFVKNDNPKKGEPVRKAQNILIKRDPKRSYFNMLWMVLFTGIVKIATGK